MLHTKKAFTLVELMIVIAIIGILAAALFPQMSQYMARARDTATQSQIKKIIPIILMYIQDTNGNIPGLIPNNFMAVTPAGSPCSWYAGCISIPDINLKKESFSILTDSSPTVFFRYVDTQNGGDTKLLSGMTLPRYMIEWTLPGSSGVPAGQTLTEPTDNIIANQRCVPGTVRWINLDATRQNTSCHIVIQ